MSHSIDEVSIKISIQKAKDSFCVLTDDYLGYYDEIWESLGDGYAPHMMTVKIYGDSWIPQEHLITKGFTLIDDGYRPRREFPRPAFKPYSLWLVSPTAAAIEIGRSHWRVKNPGDALETGFFSMDHGCSADNDMAIYYQQLVDQIGGEKKFRNHYMIDDFKSEALELLVKQGLKYRPEVGTGNVAAYLSQVIRNRLCKSIAKELRYKEAVSDNPLVNTYFNPQQEDL